MKPEILLASVLLLASLTGSAQSQSSESSKPIEELRLKLNDDGSHYLKATLLNQVWVKFNDNNPGTLILGEPADQSLDIGLRRTRFQFYGTLTDHVSFYFQVGQNNFNFLSQNAGNRKLQFFVHDALGEYKIWKGSDKLILGGGLTIANGLSRFSQPSVSTIMSMDVPVFLQATVDQTDEFSRKLSVFTRGQLGKLNYRLVMSDPFPISTNGTTAFPSTVATSPYASFAEVGHYKQYQGLFMWNFLDTEQMTTPYMTGTYLGKKRVFNLEAGFITQKNATWTGDGFTNTFHDMNLWSVAMFYDAPMDEARGTALNAYFGYTITDYGPGYLRYNNAMSPGTGSTATAIPGITGSIAGSTFPMFGTGSQIYAQIGYLMKKDLFGEGNGTLMPYATIQSADFDRISTRMNVFDVGINWLIKGHTSKFTLDYQSRPTFEVSGSELVESGTRRGQLVLQYQIFF